MAEVAGPLVLVGCGKMGAALLQGWLKRGLEPRDALVVEPDAAAREALRERQGVVAVAEPKALPTELEPRALVFAIKPQMMAGVLPAYEPLARSGAVILSIAAGTTVARFEAAFGSEVPIVRAMPNTPAAIGRGVSAIYANRSVTPAQRELCLSLMAAVGGVHWVDDEEHMHAITAMSGGGPAYVFLLIEAIARAGMASGLPEDLAWPLARATVIGSGALAAASDEPAEVLRRNVTSPGGTTQAALEVLMAENGIQPLFDRAIAAGTRRSRELA